MCSETSQTTRFVVGLGNPGREYRGTRHNAGFMVVRELAVRCGAGDGRSAFQGVLLDGRFERGGERRRVMMFAPQTYMNRSGQAVAELLRFYKADPDDLLVVMDDMDLPLGAIRARAGGSAGGHKGLADILRALGTTDAPRLRIGIGQPPGQMDPADYVLSKFPAKELETFAPAVRTAADAVEDWVFHGIENVMQEYNRKTQTTGNADE